LKKRLCGAIIFLGLAFGRVICTSYQVSTNTYLSHLFGFIPKEVQINVSQANKSIFVNKIILSNFGRGSAAAFGFRRQRAGAD
jgi:hypothetical protein